MGLRGTAGTLECQGFVPRVKLVLFGLLVRGLGGNTRDMGVPASLLSLCTGDMRDRWTLCPGRSRPEGSGTVNGDGGLSGLLLGITEAQSQSLRAVGTHMGDHGLRPGPRRMAGRASLRVKGTCEAVTVSTARPASPKRPAGS